MLIRSWLNKSLRKTFSKKSPWFSGVFLFLTLLLLTSCDFFSNRILNKTVVSVDSIRMTTQEFSRALANKLKNLNALSAKDPQIILKFKACKIPVYNQSWFNVCFTVSWRHRKRKNQKTTEIKNKWVDFPRGWPAIGYWSMEGRNRFNRICYITGNSFYFISY